MSKTSKTSKTSKKRDVEKEYQKLTPEQAVLHRPASYIGSTNDAEIATWIPDTTGKMSHSQCIYNPGLYKIFDECLTNALDEAFRSGVKDIKVTADNNSFTVWNDTKAGIPIEIHKTHKMYVPEMIFSHVHSSSNYDDSEDRVWAGTNGVGAKAAVIFSTSSEIEIQYNKKKYTQVFEKNLTIRNKPVIGSCGSTNSVQITINPDFARFGMQNFESNDTIKMMFKRTLEVGALSPDKVSLWWNDEKLSVKNFETYANLFIGDDRVEVPRVYQKDGNWRVLVCRSPLDHFVQISSVNGCATLEGGTHVESVIHPVVKYVSEKLQAKHKDVTIKNQYIRDNIMVFVDCQVVNPKFSSQTKEKLISSSRELGNKFGGGDAFLKAVEKLGVTDNVLAIANAKDLKSLRNGQVKKSRLNDILKLNDANKAGTNQGHKCTIILTEGDSAMSMAISGIQNRDHFGVFPLRGKLLNVREVAAKKLSANAEIQHIIQILGLKYGVEYENSDKLRYGKVLIMTDQDEDGFHIKGLLFNLFDCFWPSLLKIPGFISSMLTPVIKAKKTGQEIMEFYNIPDYNNWKESAGSGWNVKYYKGLGTSTPKEAKEYFRRMNTLQYVYTDEADQTAVLKAFSKDIKGGATDKRKDWIQEAISNPQDIDYKMKMVPVKDFIDKELVLFSIADVRRSLPSIVDGLKVSQRKVLYGCFKRNLTKEVKVAQLAGYVSEHSAYHHGEASLTSTIVGMAQQYVGHNNINLLAPNGQFGSRLKGGQDAASARYIFTKLQPITSKVFNPEDSVLLNYLEDDGMKIEPEYYMPTIPMLLANGSNGIGTGFSVTIPSFNPKDIKENIIRLMDSKGTPEDTVLKEMTPWYKGFTGKVIKVSTNKWSTSGCYKVQRNKVHITELPVGTWTCTYIEYLKKLEMNSEIQRYDDYSNEVNVKITITFGPSYITDLIKKNKLEDLLKLKSSVSATNIHVIDENGQIVKIANAEDIIRRFYVIRKKFYIRRKEHLEVRTSHELKILENKIRFITEAGKSELVLFGKKKAIIVDELKKKKYYKSKSEKDKTGYQYLLDIKCENFTDEKVMSLEADIKKKRDYLSTLVVKTGLDLWKEDLS